MRSSHAASNTCSADASAASGNDSAAVSGHVTLVAPPVVVADMTAPPGCSVPPAGPAGIGASSADVASDVPPVGARIEVEWEHEDGAPQWYAGRVTSQLGLRDRPMIAYDDGALEELEPDDLWRRKRPRPSAHRKGRALGARTSLSRALVCVQQPHGTQPVVAPQQSSLPPPPHGFVYKVCVNCGCKGHGFSCHFGPRGW